MTHSPSITKSNHNITFQADLISPKKFKNNNPNHFHGGQLIEIAKQYEIPLDEWIDLSTGINPNGYPANGIPESVWNRLPENNDKLVETAAQYYQCHTNSLLPVSGTQFAIQVIPGLFSQSTIGLIQPGYYEHAKHWKKHNHTIVSFEHNPENDAETNLALINQINKKIHELDVLLIINPNNPTGLIFSKQQLLQWQEILLKQNSYLIVDEAFMDSNTCNSLISSISRPNLIILRSTGKFFGLAGIRLGFVFSNQSILNKISELQGPWPISGPSRWLAQKALADAQWQKETLVEIQKNSRRLQSLLSIHHLKPNGGTDLYQWIKTSYATKIYHHLNKHGILTRLFSDPSSLRVGLPKNEIEWQKLELALHSCKLQ
jgi:cobalamin biosynthetic protein CobC